MDTPTVHDVGRIAALPDPILRNLLITQSYYDLSQAMVRLTGRGANWCTFATWASKQAGQTIRGEDLARAVEDRYTRSPEVQAILYSLQGALERFGKRRDVQALRQALFAALDPEAALRRAGEAVAQGNLKVFEEIGHECARFLATFEAAASAEDAALAFEADKVRLFCAALRPGEPPEGQRLLTGAFTAYAEACLEMDPAIRSERLFFANLLVGLHEQTRLQPEIAAAMEASLGDPEAVRERLLQVLVPGFWLRLRVRLARLLKGRLPLDVALDRLIHQVRQQVRHVLTEALMTLRLPDEEVLRMGRNLDRPFPPELARLTHPPLLALVDQVDPTPDSATDSGTDDWADLTDRMHFITDLFRCYHAWAPLFEAPFTAAQVAHLKAGRRPEGRL